MVCVLAGYKEHVSETPICSQFCLLAIFGESIRNFGGVFAILFEGLLMEIQEIHDLAVLGGGRSNCEQTFCEQTGVS